MNRFCIGWFYQIIEMSAKKGLHYPSINDINYSGNLFVNGPSNFQIIFIWFSNGEKGHTHNDFPLLLDINTFFSFLFALLNICIIRFIHSRTIIIIDAYFEGLFVYLPKYFRENGLWSLSTENNSPFLPNIGHCALVN